MVSWEKGVKVYGKVWEVVKGGGEKGENLEAGARGKGIVMYRVDRYTCSKQANIQTNLSWYIHIFLVFFAL